MDVIHSAVAGSMPRTIVRFPEDVTALADRGDGSFQRDKDATTVKKSVTKTYHTLKDLISSKFKKDANEQSDELNNVTSMLHGHQSNLDQGQSSSQQQQQQQHSGNNQSGSYMYSSASDNNLLQAQSNLNVWPSGSQTNSPLYYHKKFSDPAESFGGSKALSQPQLNMAGEQGSRNTQHVVSMLPAPVDGTDSDDGGFRQHSVSRQTNQPLPNGSGQGQGAAMHANRSTPQQPAYIQNYRHNHGQQQQQQQPHNQQQQHLQQQHHMSYQQAVHNAKQRAAMEGGSGSNMQSSSYNTTVTVGEQSGGHHHHPHHHHHHNQGEAGMQKHTISVDINSGSSVNISTGESHDAGAYDKNGNHSSNVDSGRGSSSMATASADAVMEKNKVKSDGEWVSTVNVALGSSI